MEQYIEFKGVIIMKEYKKPVILSQSKRTNIVPLALGAAALAAGGAFSVGVASGLMKDDKNHLSRIPSIKKVQVV